MGIVDRRKGKKNPLLGRISSQQLRQAAREISAFADYNTRRTAVEAGKPDYAAQERQEVGCIEERLTSGLWRAYTVLEPIPGHGTVDVVRELRENLEPALRLGILNKLCQGGMFNDFESAKRFVCDRLDIRMVESFAGKVQA